MDKFTIEKNAKNRAYAFIIAMGLFNEFSKVTKTTENYTPEEIHTATLHFIAE